MTTLDGGRVTLEAPLGQGGMGTVYRGRMRGHEPLVAVKLLRAEGVNPADRATLAARLRDEAAAAACVVHPNLVRVLASGDCPHHGPYIVYELVEGGSLEERLAKGPLPWEEVEERLAPQLLGALGALHAAGIVHRDVKPDNVFVTPDGRYLLGDLGLAVFEGRSALTATGVVVGTPGYLAPERITQPGLPPTPAADVYAAAMVLVRAAAGRLPFTASAPAALVREQLSRPLSARALEELGLPGGAARVLALAVDHDPAVRLGSSGELWARLHAVSREPAPSATTEVRRSLESSSATASVLVAGSRKRSVPPRRLLPSLAVAAILLVVLALSRSGLAPSIEGPSTGSGFVRDSTAELVRDARPLVPDVVTRLVEPGGPDSPGSLLRSVSLGAGTTSPGAVAFRCLVEGAPSPQVFSAASGYAAALRASEPSRAASGTLLLTLLLARTEPGAPVPDDLALAVFDVLAHLPSPYRSGPEGRSLLVALDLVLAQDMDGGPPSSAVEALSLALMAPALPPSLRALGASLGLRVLPPLPEAAFLGSLKALAEPALRRERFPDLKLMETDKVYVAYDRLSGGGAEGEARVAAAAGRLVDDWYRMVPAAFLVSHPPPPAPFPAVVRSVGILLDVLAKTSRVVNRPQGLERVTSGPFRSAPLAGRMALAMRRLAERVAAGCRESRTLFLRDVDELVRILHRQGGNSSASFLDPMDAVLAGAPGCSAPLLTLRGHRRLVAGDLSEGGRLLLEAAGAVLDVVDGPGGGLVEGDVQAVRFAVRGLRKMGIGSIDEALWHRVQARAQNVAARLGTDPALTQAAVDAYAELREELERAER